VGSAVLDRETTRTDVFGKQLLEFKSAVVSANREGLHQVRGRAAEKENAETVTFPY
jgi:hypothetical protein